MSDHQHSPALLQKACKHCKEAAYTGSVKPDSRLVQDNELGLHCKHPGKSHASLLPARKTLGIERTKRLRIQANVGKCMNGHTQGIAATQSAVLRAKRNIVDNSSLKKLVFNMLESKSDRAGSDRAPIKSGIARAGRKQASENACERCLARSRITHKKGQLSWLNFHVNTPQRK